MTDVWLDGVRGPMLATSVEEIMNILDPRGPAGSSLAGVAWLLFILGGLVFVVVCVLLALALFRHRGDVEVAQDRWTGEQFAGGSNLLVLLGGIAIPSVVILGLMVVTVLVGHDVRALGNPGPAERIEVVGHKFWWDVLYTDDDVRIANEVRVPAGRPVELTLRSADVIHSFWVPQVAGKIDMVPGEENVLRIQADEPGTYRGICTEYCGVQHARMHFLLVAMPPDDYDEWVAERSGAEAVEPVDERTQQGREVFEDAQCIECHTVRGVSPDTDVGPDLTHYGDRQSIAAGILDNTDDNLGTWIVEPQILKPGSRMPPANLDAEDLDALIAYLQSLE